MKVDMLLLILSAGTGMLFIALAIPLILKKVPPNRWYGLRVPATFANDKVWYKANAWTAKVMLGWGLFILIAGIVLSFAPLAQWVKWLLWCSTVLGGAIVTTIRGWQYANQLLKDQ